MLSVLRTRMARSGFIAGLPFSRPDNGLDGFGDLLAADHLEGGAELGGSARRHQAGSSGSSLPAAFDDDEPFGGGDERPGRDAVSRFAKLSARQARLASVTAGALANADVRRHFASEGNAGVKASCVIKGTVNAGPIRPVDPDAAPPRTPNPIKAAELPLRLRG